MSKRSLRASKPGRLVRLSESAEKAVSLAASSAAVHHRYFLKAAKSKTGETWEATLVVEGWSLNERFYPRESIEQMKKLIDSMPDSKIPIRAFAFGDFDHMPSELQAMMPGPAGNLVGFAENAQILIVDGKASLIATIQIFENAQWLRDLLRGAFEKSALGMLGLSLDGEGVVREGEAEGRRGLIVDAVTALNSFDVVTHPAAGGMFNKMVASRKGEKTAMNNLKKLLASVAHILGIDAKGKEHKHVAEAIVEHKRVKHGSALKAGIEKILDLLAASGDDDAEIVEAINEQVAGLGVDIVYEGITGLRASEGDEDGDGDADEDGGDGDADGDADGDGDSDDGDGDGDADGDGEEEEVSEAMKKVIANFEKRLDKAEKRADAAEQENRVKASKAIQKAVVDGSGLPQEVRDQLLAEMDGMVLNESQVNKRIRAHREYLGRLSESGHIVDLGINDKDSILRESRTDLDKRRVALDLAMGYKFDKDEALSESQKKAYKDTRRLKSIREMYVWYTGDEAIDGVVYPEKAFGGRGRSHLGEAISTSTFTFALGTSMNKIMQQEYRAYESPWRQFAEVIPAENFKSHELIQWGTLGDIATVLEGATYLELDVPSDFEAVFTPTKRGGVVSITREAIINDDMRFLARVPRMVGRAANRVNEQFVYDLLLNVSGGVINAGTNAPDGTALYSVAHGNLVVDSVDSASVELAQQKLWEQTDSGEASEELGLEPYNAVFPRALRSTMRQIQNSDRVVDSAENQINTLQGSFTNLITSSKMRGSKTAAVITANPMDIDLMTIGYINGQEEPTLIQQNNEAVGAVFTNDKMAWKVRHEYGGAINDHRGFVMIKPA